MSDRITFFSLFLLRKLVDGVLFLLRFFVAIVSRMCLPPLRRIGRFLWSAAILPGYRTYLLTKKEIDAILLPAKNKLLYVFSSRYVLHGFLVLIAIVVLTNNVSAREYRSDEVGQGSIALLVTSGENDFDIIETATVAGSDGDVMDLEGGLSSEEQFNAQLDSEETGDTAITEEGALVKPDIASTNLGDRLASGIQKHVVQNGETISEIAEQYGVSVATILGENQIRETEMIRPGQELTILPVTQRFGNSASHRIAKGDTLSSIAGKYGAKAEDIMAFNNLVAEDAIKEGDILIIPGGVKKPPELPAAPRQGLARLFDSGPKPADGAALRGAKLRWPTVGTRINQRFRYGHRAVDIGSKLGTAVYAANDGVVVKVSYQKSGYGHHVIIDHGGGMQTLYSHNSEQYVKVGDRVTRGQTIAKIGLTGRTTGPHVHFEVRINGSAVNPLNYL